MPKLSKKVTWPKMETEVETRPSGSSRWTKCFAAPLFSKRAGPQPDSDPAREGTCAAWLGDLALKNQIFNCREMLGECHANGWEIDAEMVGHVQNYVDMVRAEGGFVSAERFVRLSPLIAGTLDNSASFTNGVLRVRDLKYGFLLVPPDAEQLVIYGGALAAELIESGQQIHTVITEIYQPRGFSTDGIHRRHEWSVTELFERCEWIIKCAEECHKPNPMASVGLHCVNCEGAVGCQALLATAANLYTFTQSTAHRQMTAVEIAEQLQFLRLAKKVIDAAASAVETEALVRHKSGDPIPNMRLKERQGNATFKHDRKYIKVLTGVDPVKQVAMSPAELRAAGVSAAKIKALTYKPQIGFKLEPVDPRDIAREFSKGYTHHGK